jgi:hypothetical protein
MKNTELGGGIMQLKLGEDANQKRQELAKKRKEDEDERRKREAKKSYFEAHFRYGSTTVMKRNGEFLLKGDIARCGKESIFHNARKIKAMMEKNRKTLGYMDYDEPPSFHSNWSWEREERERKEIYEEDLYKFVGNEIVVADLIGSEPIGHIYKNN